MTTFTTAEARAIVEAAEAGLQRDHGPTSRVLRRS
jgi:hypothetical protein